MSQETRSVILSGGVLGGGGVQTHLSLLAKLLRTRANADVVLLGSASHWPGDVLEDVRASGVRVLLPPANLAAGSRLAKLATLFNLKFRLSRGNHTVYCIGEGRLHSHVVRRLSPPSYSVYHEIVDAHNPGMTSVRCDAPVDAYIANSQPVAAGMRAVLPATSPVRIIPFLTSDTPSPAPAPRAAVGDRPLRVTYLGRFASHKRPDVLIREWPAMTASTPIGPAELDIYGYGELHEELEKLALDVAIGLSAGSAVRVRGRYAAAELPAILDRSDVVVLPSLFEGLPLVLVEAMLRGVPIVACEAGGTRELAIDNPGAIVTSTEWPDFVSGLREMAGEIRTGSVDALRLHQLTESRYGFETVWNLWRDAMLSPRAFFTSSEAAPARM